MQCRTNDIWLEEWGGDRPRKNTWNPSRETEIALGGIVRNGRPWANGKLGYLYFILYSRRGFDETSLAVRRLCE